MVDTDEMRKDLRTVSGLFCVYAAKLPQRVVCLQETWIFSYDIHQF